MVLQRIVAIRQDNSEALAVEQEGRTRRDDVLTSAALVMAELMAAGVHRSREQLLTLASQLREPATPRRLAAPEAFLARLVCGSGRHANTYTSLGRAAEIMARIPAGERKTALTTAGGVTGLARQATPTRATTVQPATKWANPAQGWSPGLAALTRNGERRVVTALIEVGGGEEPTVLVAEVPGRVRVAMVEGRELGTLERTRLLRQGGQCVGERGMLVAISRPVMDMVATGMVRVEACDASDNAAVPELHSHTDDRG
jgi:hypothetical protein